MAPESHRLGYGNVDGDPHRAVLRDTMNATGRWPATRELRDWERRELALDPRHRVLDVGCGLGDAVIALAGHLGPEGEVVGIDNSAEMIAGATGRAHGMTGGVRFAVADAMALPEPSESFDVVRSERTLQWLTDPGAAVAEMRRVVRPGGFVSLIDTDWSTFAIDVGDGDVSRPVREAFRTERRRPSNIGRRLADVARGAGLRPVAHTAATHTWEAWDPDRAPAPDGCFSMTSLADDLVDVGQLAPTERDEFVSTIHDAARSGCFSMALTMYALVATRPR